MDVRVLSGAEPTRHPGELSDADLDELYRVPAKNWLRVNMVSTVDGAAAGSDGRSGGINNAADKRVFDALRRACDAVLVGAGTAREEGYHAIDRPLVLVSRRADVPEALRDQASGRVWMATCADAPGLDEARDRLGDDQVLVLGSDRVDLRRLREELAGRGLAQVLCEGGPHLLRDLLAEGLVDELDLTVVPRLLAGDQPRIAVGPPVDAGLQLRLLLEDDGTVLTRWLTRPTTGPARGDPPPTLL